MIRAVTIFLFVVIVFAPLQSRAQQSAGSASIKDIFAALDSQSVAWNRGDIEGYMQYYWHSDSLLFTSGGNVRRGWNATLGKYKKATTQEQRWDR